MRAWMLILAGVLSSGCTHLALERRTIKQASTLSDLQHQQVLDNLAMLACNKDAMPWHLKLKGGLVQIADQGSGGFAADIAAGLGGEPTRLLPSAGAQRGVVGQWDVDPAVEADELALLGLAYRKATCPADPELLGKFDKAICDLSVRYDIIPDEDVLKRVFCSGNVLAKIDGQMKDTCERLQKAQSNIMESEVDAALPGCSKELKAKLAEGKDSPLARYTTALRAELSLRLLDLVQTKAAVKEVLERPAEQPAGQRTYGAVRSLAAQAARPGVGGPRPVRVFEKENKQEELPRPLSGAEQVLFALHLACDPGYIPPAWAHEPNGRNVGLVAQAGDKIEKLQGLIKEAKFQQPWLNVGCKKDVPRCACYVGHYKGCHGDCYVWVMPEHYQTLRDFTQVILTLAPNERQDLSLTVPGRGAAFSPTTGGQR